MIGPSRARARTHPGATRAHLPRRGALACLLLGAGLTSSPAGAQDVDMRPPARREVAVVEQLGARLPGQLRLRGEAGRTVALGSQFDGRRPLLLTLAYVDCPKLCNLLLHGLASSVARLEHRVGVDFRVATVALDPTETKADARSRQRELNKGIPRIAGDPGWRYLRGREQDILALATALGFHYAWDPRTQTYAHPAVAFVLTPDGVVSEYLHGIRFDPAVLDQALARAASDRVAAPVGQSVLSCFVFDPALRRHRAQIQTLFRAGSASVFAALLSLVAGLWYWERRRRS